MCVRDLPMLPEKGSAAVEVVLVDYWMSIYEKKGVESAITQLVHQWLVMFWMWMEGGE